MKRAAFVFAATVSLVALAGVLVGQAPPSIPAPTLINAPPVTLTAAQINALFVTPVLLIPAQGPGTIVRITGCVFNAIYGGAAFTGGAAISPWFIAGTSLAGSSVAATFLTGLTVNSVTATANAIPVTQGSWSINQPVYLWNPTQAFAGGSGASMIVSCQYFVLSGLQ